MNAQTYQEVLQEAEKPPPDQRLMLIERRVRHVHTAKSTPEASPTWEDHAGSVPYPLCGEDAQEWVNSGRVDSLEARRAM